MSKTTTFLGAHFSASGGLYHALEEGEYLSCNAIQLFTHSNRQWAFKELSTQTIDTFIKKQNQSRIEKVVVHASYLMNPASPEKHTRVRSIQMLILELKACHSLKVRYMVLHPGSRLTSEPTIALATCAYSINKALEGSRDTMILIENMAGQGTAIGSRLEELASLYEKIEDKDRIGFCFDTCHAFAAGYDFTNSTTYALFWEQFDKIIGINKVQVIHLNDSKKELGSHVDRHSNIGEGRIGLEAFSLLMNDDRFNDVVKILETPKDQGLESDRKNLNTIRSLIKK